MNAQKQSINTLYKRLRQQQLDIDQLRSQNHKMAETIVDQCRQIDMLRNRLADSAPSWLELAQA
jgi:uncharacterized coiled-coil protein SlyX